MAVIIFGAGSYGKKAFQVLSKTKSILAFCDNDETKQELLHYSIPILSPSKLSDLEYEYIYIASIYLEQIYSQLIDLGINNSKIKIFPMPDKGFAEKIRDAVHKPLFLTEGYFRALSLKINLPLHQDDLKISKYFNKHKGKTAYILGNGPSVKINDLEKMDNTDGIIFSANRFYLAYPKMKMRPNYTTCIDKLVLERHEKAISKYCDTPLFVSRRFSDIKQSPSSNIISVREELTGLKLQSENPYDYYFGNNATKGFGFGFGVIYTMIQLAVWMGCSRIFLYGIDHSFVLPSNYLLPGIPVKDHGEQNHFIEGYRAQGERWAPPNYPKTEAAFKRAKSWCKSMEIPIFNATRGGKLNIFERIDLESTLNL